MKKFLLINLLLAGFLVAQPGSPNLGTNYAWQSKIAVDTSKVDTTFSERWEDALIFFVGCDGYIKYSDAADTTGFTSRYWIPLIEYQPLTIDASTRLKRAWFKAQSDSGHIYILGYKKVVQF